MENLNVLKYFCVCRGHNCIMPRLTENCLYEETMAVIEVASCCTLKDTHYIKSNHSKEIVY